MKQVRGDWLNYRSSVTYVTLGLGHGAVAADGTTQPRRQRQGRGARPARQPRSGTFMQRLEQRLERRRDQGQGWGG